MAKTTPKTTQSAGPEATDKPVNPHKIEDAEELKAAWARILAHLPAACAEAGDGDEGAIFGRVMTRAKAWLEEHDAPQAMLAEAMDEIQASVKKLVTERKASAATRAVAVAGRQQANILKALEG